MVASIGSALDAWRDFYGGESLTLDGAPPGLEISAVRCNDFRPDSGNWPRILHHRRPTARALVLIHGLKDSPGYLEDIAKRFASNGLNVVLPLLPGHGRLDPKREMGRVSFHDWRSTVDRTVEIAGSLGDQLSIGGLSTGGALALDKCLRDPSAIGGKIFLFAAALGLTPLGRTVLSSPLLTHLGDVWMSLKANDGIGGNPIKYSRDFFAAGRQVQLLIEILLRLDGDLVRLRDRAFVAHSEGDRTIPVEAIKLLVADDDPGQHHIIPESVGVNHADLVMASAMSFEKRWPDEPDPTPANPEFEPMIEKALAFLDR